MTSEADAEQTTDPATAAAWRRVLRARQLPSPEADPAWAARGAAGVRGGGAPWEKASGPACWLKSWNSSTRTKSIGERSE